MALRFMTCQALSIMDQRQENGRRYTLFVDSTSAISRILSEDIGPGQCFAVASIEVAAQILARGGEITVRWVPAHHEVPGNERADEFVKAMADGSYPNDSVSDEYRWETSLSHMTRVAVKARSRSAARWTRAALETLQGSTDPPGEGPEAQAPPRNAEVSREQVLPDPDRSRSDRPLP